MPKLQIKKMLCIISLMLLVCGLLGCRQRKVSGNAPTGTKVTVEIPANVDSPSGTQTYEAGTQTSEVGFQTYEAGSKSSEVESQSYETEKEYWSANMSNFYFEDVRLPNSEGLYSGLEVTGKTLADAVDIYHGEGLLYYYMDGAERIELNTNGKYAFFSDGVYELQKEGFLTETILRVGTEKQKFLEKKVTDSAKIMSRIGVAALEPVISYEGVILDDVDMRELEDSPYVSLEQLCDFLGFVISDEGALVQVYGHGIHWTFSALSEDVEVSSLYTKAYYAGKPEDSTVRYLRTDAKLAKVSGDTNVNWIPVEYLTEVFGITYNWDSASRVVYLVEGVFLPQTVLLNTEELVNLYDTGLNPVDVEKIKETDKLKGNVEAESSGAELPGVELPEAESPEAESSEVGSPEVPKYNSGWQLG